jgi:hypothetical protein
MSMEAVGPALADWPAVLRYPRSIGTFSDDCQVHICVGGQAVAKQFTGMGNRPVSCDQSGWQEAARRCLVVLGS